MHQKLLQVETDKYKLFTVLLGTYVLQQRQRRHSNKKLSTDRVTTTRQIPAW